MNNSVKRRRNRRERARTIALEMLAERGAVSTQEINAEFGRQRLKSSVQYAGLIMRSLVLSGVVDRFFTSENHAYYRLVSDE